MKLNELKKDTKIIGVDFFSSEDVFTVSELGSRLHDFLGLYDEDENNEEQNADLIKDFQECLSVAEECDSLVISDYTPINLLIKELGTDYERADYFYMIPDKDEEKSLFTKDLATAIEEIFNNRIAYKAGEKIEVSTEELISLWKNS